MSALTYHWKRRETRKRLRLHPWGLLLLPSSKSRLTTPWEGSSDRHCIPKPRNQVRMSALAHFETCREIWKYLCSAKWRILLLLSPKLCKPVGMRRLLQLTLHTKIGHERDHECACGLWDLLIRLHVVFASFTPSRVHLTKSQVHCLHVHSAAHPTKTHTIPFYVQRKTFRIHVSKTPGDSGMLRKLILDETCVFSSPLPKIYVLHWHGECRD